MPDAEKSLGEQPAALIEVPDKVDNKEPSPNDAGSSEKKEGAEEKESKGSMKDYLVGGEPNYHCCSELTYWNSSESSDMRTIWTVFCTRLHSQVPL